METNVILDYLTGLVDTTQLYTLLGLIAAHVLIGALGSMIKGTFDLYRFLNFYRDVAVYVVGYLAAGLLGSVLDNWAPIQDVAFAGIVAFISDRILLKLNEFGLPVPQGFRPALNRTMNVVGWPVGKMLKKR